ncbi:hypothetical protein DYI25_05525 [Mesobacillus boroniphilus]|uniref:Uncharacterized protein n=1 Tax=Mesobacillus boroniphilus TaxID=308892 RepID=A0A944CK92_9BACI|nr:hypothetical protein [Mesobacillus boroniphilus]MBS8263896.1 hypothetical protein [Mesobacillus boroniphilus]
MEKQILDILMSMQKDLSDVKNDLAKVQKDLNEVKTDVQEVKTTVDRIEMAQTEDVIANLEVNKKKTDFEI